MSESRAPNLPKPVRTLFLIALVVAPLYWLIMTESGRHTTDLVMLELFGKDTISLKVENLGADVSETVFLQQFPDVEFSCKDQKSDFGDRVCESSIGSFNDLPSQHLALYFNNDSLGAMKVIYQLTYHDMAINRMESQITADGQILEPMNALIEWRTPGGVMVMNRTAPKRHEDAAIIWIAD